MKEFLRRRKARKMLALEGKVDLSTTIEDLLIAAAAHGRAVLIHRDGDFRRIAEAAGLKEEMI